MLNKKGKNSALICFMCGTSTEAAAITGKMFFRSATAGAKSTAAICADCVADTFIILSQAQPEMCESRNPNFEDFFGQTPTPKKIYTQLNKFVMGQDKAKKALSVALANHFLRMYDASIQKSNVLLIGPTGTGKTELARAAAKILDVPFVVADATTFTAHGYVGEDVESVLTRLLQASDMNLEKAQCGIVFIDEIDKIADKDNNSYVGTLAVQQSLLKIVEGTMVNVPKEQKVKGSGSGEMVQFDTSKVLFICAGAFSGLDEILLSESKQNRRIGIGFDPENNIKVDLGALYQTVNQKHLVKYGLIPEFLGRFQIVPNTNELTIEELEMILTEPVNSVIKQYKKLLSKYDVEIEFTKDFISSVAKEAKETGMGARGLKSIIEKRLEKILFEAPDYENDQKKIVL